MEDAKEGLKANIKAVVATIMLLTISLCATGAMILIKASADQTITILQSQVKLKVYLSADVDTQKVNRILQKASWVKETTIETKEESLRQLKPFFKGKEYLFEAFQQRTFPDAILIEVRDSNEMTVIVNEVKKIQGVEDVIYPQSFAQFVMKLNHYVNIYGTLLLLVCFGVCLLTIHMAIHLSLYQRQKEIRVKLLLGAKESHVRGQFLFEGGLIGLVAGILACLLVYVMYICVFYPLITNYSYLVTLSMSSVNWLLAGLIIGGTLLGFLGSYLATKKLITHE